VRLDVLGVDGQHLVERLDRFPIAAIEEQDAADLVRHDAVVRILGADPVQVGESATVVAVRLLD